MADSNGDRNALGVVVTVLGLLATMVGGALSFQQRVLNEVRISLATELKYAATREELLEFRRQQSEVDAQRHLALVRRLDQIEFKLKELGRRRR